MEIVFPVVVASAGSDKSGPEVVETMLLNEEDPPVRVFDDDVGVDFSTKICLPSVVPLGISDSSCLVFKLFVVLLLFSAAVLVSYLSSVGV